MVFAAKTGSYLATKEICDWCVSLQAEVDVVRWRRLPGDRFSEGGEQRRLDHHLVPNLHSHAQPGLFG